MTACLLKNEPVSYSPPFSLSKSTCAGAVKAIPNWDIQKRRGLDPKLGELTLGRVNPDENREEARTRDCSNSLR